MSHQLPALVGSVLCSAALVGCSGLLGDDARSAARDDFERANYEQAYYGLVDSGHSTADTPEFRAVELAFLLSRGQSLVFAERDREAIALFERVLVLEPGHAVATVWLERCKRELAGQASRRGEDHRRRGELKEALLAYHDAQQWVAEWPEASSGVAEVAAAVNRREAHAEQQYLDGVRALGEQLWGQSWYHMVNAVVSKPDHERAIARRNEIGARLLEDRMAEALEMERGAHYGAALKEYLAIKDQRPDFPGLDEHIATMRREVETDALVRVAEMAVSRQEFTKARESLEKAMVLTGLQQVAISDLMTLVRERDLDYRYEQANVLELEHRFEEALTAFVAIDVEWEAFKDVRTRISGLEAAIEVAAAAYARGQEAEQNGDRAAALAAYRDAVLVYPGYRGLDARIKDLSAK